MQGQRSEGDKLEINGELMAAGKSAGLHLGDTLRRVHACNPQAFQPAHDVLLQALNSDKASGPGHATLSRTVDLLFALTHREDGEAVASGVAALVEMSQNPMEFAARVERAHDIYSTLTFVKLLSGEEALPKLIDETFRPNLSNGNGKNKPSQN